MDIGAALSVAQTLFALLQCTQLRKVWSISDYKYQLDSLSCTVDTIKVVLLHAAAKWDHLSPEACRYVEDLRDALYDADDLFDEFLTIVKQTHQIQASNFSKQVCALFSSFNQIGVAYNMSRGVQKVVKKLDLIASNRTKFVLDLDHSPTRTRREETSSYVHYSGIIGRDEDLEKIVPKFLNPNIQQDISFLTIVGMGGLGKTALAQLLYNDPRIAEHFPLRVWACVSDHDQNKFDVKAILAQILESSTYQKSGSMELIQRQLREQLVGKRFLLVLDDVWTENRVEWCKLVRYLTGAQTGSWVVVTSRSKKTANIVGITSMYELQGLSQENSWQLFRQSAFDQANSDLISEFTNIGQEIVKKCGNVPLAIKVVGSLLYGQEKSKWASLREFGVTSLRESDNAIKDVLKLSYNNLEPPLKSCFSYCALFPKDVRMDKDELISLWMAQGYIVPFENGQNIEDAAEEYFLILLRRCFFQDVKISSWNQRISIKMHDLMHDVALEVAEKDICAVSCCDELTDKVRHVSLMRRKYTEYSFNKAHIRTFLLIGVLDRRHELLVDTLVSNYRRLRSLDLSHLNLKNLPDSIGELLHLRYLNVSNNKSLELLPRSVTKLYNLQTLNLGSCSRLKELPEDLNNLLNLRALGLYRCDVLTCMPRGIGKLTGLHQLTQFVVSKGNSRKQHAELQGLKALKNLRGFIKIKIHFPKSGACVNTNEGAYLCDKENLSRIEFKCKVDDRNGGGNDHEEELLGALQPHSSLKILSVWGYAGVRMPRWALEDNLATFLPNLVRLKLSNCSELKCISSLGKLQCLKLLSMNKLLNLKNIDDYPQTSPFLPSLEKLDLSCLPKLKGWRQRRGEWVRTDNSNNEEPFHSTFPSFPLSDLKVEDCPNLTRIPLCPNLESVRLLKFNGRLRIMAPNSRVIGEASSSCPKIRRVKVDNTAWLQSTLSMLPPQGIEYLTWLQINGDKEVESLLEYEHLFQICSSSLQTLSILECPKLRSVSGGLKHLTALESLSLNGIPIAGLADDEVEGEGAPWGSLHYSLRYLDIAYCSQLKSMPKWIQKLTSLQTLSIVGCSVGLYERCQNPNGEDWANIQHIPNKHICP